MNMFLLSRMFSQVHWSFLKKGCLLISSKPLRPSRTSLQRQDFLVKRKTLTFQAFATRQLCGGWRGFRWRFRNRVTCSGVSWMERILPNGQVSLLCGKRACCCSKKTTVNIMTLKKKPKKRVNIPVGMSSGHLDDIAQAVWRTYF